jgi:hypothetical protein
MAKETVRQLPPTRPSIAPPAGVLPRPIIPQVTQFPNPVTAKTRGR